MNNEEILKILNKEFIKNCTESTQLTQEEVSCMLNERNWKDLDVDKQIILLNWINNKIEPDTDVYNITSYGLKHLFENETDIYVTNEQFKGAMLMCGYIPVNFNRNSMYKIKVVA